MNGANMNGGYPQPQSIMYDHLQGEFINSNNNNQQNFHQNPISFRDRDQMYKLIIR